MKSFIVTAGFVLLMAPSIYAQKKLTATATSKGAVVSHVVTGGESLNSLSKKYNIPLAALAKANGLKATQGLKTGTTVKVPLTATNLTRSKKGIPVYYEVSGKDNLSTISHRFDGLDVKTLKSWNNLKKDVVVKGQDLLVGYLVNNAVSKEDQTEDKKATTGIASGDLKRGKKVQVSTAVNIRKGPGTDQPVIARAQKEDQVTVIKRVNSEWVSVRTNEGKKGFIAAEYLQPVEKTEEVAKAVPKKADIKKVQVGTAVNIRKGPGTDQPVVGRIEKDETITILKQVNDEWSSVRTGNGVEGYAATQFLAPAAEEPVVKKETKAADAQKVQVGTAVNVRKGPGTDQPVVGRIEKDETVTILKQVNNEWSSVRTGKGVEGYAATQFLAPAAEEPVVKKETKAADAQKVQVGTAVNVRKGPGTDQPVVGRIEKDETITILKQVNNEWSSVRTGKGVEGYAATQFLQPRAEEQEVAQNTEPAAVAPKTTPEKRSNQPENQEVSSAPVVAETPAPATYDQSGFFKTAYESQGGNAAATDQVRAGIFKTDKGWADGKYYALVDGLPAGTIVKLSNPGNNTSIYAKVLGDVKSLKQNDHLNARISDAAATALRINEDAFDLTVTH